MCTNVRKLLRFSSSLLLIEGTLVKIYPWIWIGISDLHSFIKCWIWIRKTQIQIRNPPLPKYFKLLLCFRPLTERELKRSCKSAVPYGTICKYPSRPFFGKGMSTGFFTCCVKIVSKKNKFLPVSDPNPDSNPGFKSRFKSLFESRFDSRSGSETYSRPDQKLLFGSATLLEAI